MIEIKNLIKKYDDEVIFNYLDITFKDGLTIILGKSGSGKTTLLNLISNLDPLYQGQIIIDGIDIKDVEDKELFRYQTFSFIYQDYLLFNELTIFANLSFYESSPVKIKEVLSFCNLDLSLKRKVSSLSGGEKQRLAIARAILSQGKIILGDEITGSLDRDNSHKIFALLKKLSLEKRIILITHDRELAYLYGDNIYEIKDKKLVNLKISKEKINYPSLEKNKSNNLSIKYIFTYIKEHFIQKKNRNLILISITVLGLVLVSLSLMLTSLTINDLVSSLGSYYNESSYALLKELDQGINEAYSLDRESVEMIKNEHDTVEEVGTFYITYFPGFLEESYMSFKEGNYPINFYELNILSINEYQNYYDLGLDEEKLSYDEIILKLRKKDIKRIADSLGIDDNVYSLNNYLKTEQTSIEFYFKNSQWSYEDTITLSLKKVIEGDDIGIVHSSLDFSEHLFEEKMHYQSSNDLFSHEEVPWTLKKVYYLQVKKNQSLNLLKSLCKDISYQDYSFDLIDSNYISYLSKGEHLDKIMVYCQSKDNPSLAELNSIVEEENLDNYLYSVNETYQVLNQLNLESFTYSTLIFNNEDACLKFINEHEISEENYIYSPPLLDNTYSSYLQGGIGTLNLQQSLKYQPCQNKTFLEGNVPLNYQELAISLGASKILFPNLDTSEVLGKNIYFTILRNVYYDSISYSYFWEYVKIKISGIIDDDEIKIYSFDDFNIFFYIDNFAYNFLELNLNGIKFTSPKSPEEYLQYLERKYLDYSIANPSFEINSSLDQMIKYLKMVMLFFGLLIALSSAFLSFLFSKMFLNENGKEIALFKAFGISRKSLKYIFMANCLLVGLLSFVNSSIVILFLEIFLTKDLNYLLSNDFWTIYLEGTMVNLILTILSNLLVYIFNSNKLKNILPLDYIKSKE